MEEGKTPDVRVLWWSSDVRSIQERQSVGKRHNAKVKVYKIVDCDKWMNNLELTVYSVERVSSTNSFLHKPLINSSKRAHVKNYKVCEWWNYKILCIRYAEYSNFHKTGRILSLSSSWENAINFDLYTF